MTSTDLNQIRFIVEEAIKPTNQRLDRLEIKIDRLEIKVDALSGDVEQLHLDVKGIRDNEGLFHSRNKREIDEIKRNIIDV